MDTLKLSFWSRDERVEEPWVYGGLLLSLWWSVGLSLSVGGWKTNTGSSLVSSLLFGLLSGLVSGVLSISSPVSSPHP